MINYLKIFRPINLGIIIATILVIWFSEVPKNNLTAPPPISKLYIAIVISTFIAAAGNMHNDFEDKKVDQINKPYKKFPFSDTTFWLIFILLNSVSIILSSLAFSILELAYFTLLPIFLLYLYNKYLQKTALIGNIAIAFLSSLVVVLAATISEALNTSVNFQDYIYLLITCSFLISFARELIKDCIDHSGDKENNYKTFPIITSINTAVISATFIIILNLYIVFLYSQYFTFADHLITLCLLTLLILLLSAISFLLTSKYKNKLNLSATLLKLSMVIALIILPFL